MNDGEIGKRYATPIESEGRNILGLIYQLVNTVLKPSFLYSYWVLKQGLGVIPKLI